MAAHRSRRPSRANCWYLLALFAEYALISTIWLLGLAVMVGARSFPPASFTFTLVTTVAIAYAATRMRGTLRDLIIFDDHTSGTGRKSSHAAPRHRTDTA